jgi:phenylacetic acid degradation operon negative regulatory protein
MTARSVLLSVLLGTDPPRLPVALLVSTTALFGINDGTTRTALSRMAGKGEVRADEGHYELASPRLLQRQHRQDRSRIGTTQPWEPGDAWVQAIVATSGARPRAARAELRRSLLDARLAEWRDGVWVRPANLEGVDGAATDETLVWGSVRFETDPRTLASSLWELDGWSEVAARLVDEMAALLPGLESGDHEVLAQGFVVSAAVLRQLQADPLLPDALLPPDWPGVALRDAYGRFDAAYRGVLRDWFDDHRD